MSRTCDLTNKRRMKINRVSIERSQITKRAPTFAYPNIQRSTYNIDGVTYRFDIATKTKRTINKYQNLENFLVGVKRNKLTPLGKKLRKKLYNRSINEKKD